jgi:aerobic-type carbon monoxide dehydrogenase small subunit (CoxS/CutS family)
MSRQQFRCTVNGQSWEGEIDTRVLLVEFIRDVVGLTGTKHGCGEAKCGACTVLVDGQAIKSCHALALQFEGSAIETVESLVSAKLHGAKDITVEGFSPSYQPVSWLTVENDDLNPLQRSFWKHGAVQCGFCTAGWLMAATSYLEQNPNPTVDEARQDLNGNFCRCTGYQKILEAIVDVDQHHQPVEATTPAQA